MEIKLSPMSELQESECLSDMEQNRREGAILAFLGLMLIAACIVSLGVGRFSIPVAQVFSILKEGILTMSISDDPAAVVVLLVRLPRIMLAVMVGASLSVSGAAYQGLFRNPMVSPDVLGVSSGAGVGASIAILLGGATITVQLAAFSFGIAAVFLVFMLSSAMGKGNPALLVMVLAGMVISSLFSSCNALIKYVADSADKLPEITFWLMGSFAKCGSYKNVLILLAAMLIGTVPIMIVRWKINVLAFGEEEAQAMGINTRRMRTVIVICSTTLTASCIAMCGMIGWVGLTIPHISRLLIGPNYKSLLPTSMLSGALFMVIVDDLARTVTSGEIPIGVITSLIGAPIFIYLMFKGKKGWV